MSKERKLTARQREVLEMYKQQLNQLDARYQQARAELMNQLQTAAYLALESAPKGWQLDLDSMLIVPPGDEQ